MKLGIKRAYEEPGADDGLRVLVDRLWPRGITKVKAKIDLWAKDAAPSADLRTWFHEDPDTRYAEFAKKYVAELKKNPRADDLRAELKKAREKVTLVTAVKDPDHSHVPMLVSYLRR